LYKTFLERHTINSNHRFTTDLHTAERRDLYSSSLLARRHVLVLASTSCETNRISADGNPTLCTSVVVPGGLPRATPVSAIPKIHIEKENRQSTTFIYYINQSTYLRHVPGTSPSGLNQIERNRLAANPCKRRETSYLQAARA
jgi:hypothetical protein